jgi:competence protein ComEA
MTWISNLITRVLGIQDETVSNFEKSIKPNLRIKVAIGAALIAGICIVLIAVGGSAIGGAVTQVELPKNLEASESAQPSSSANFGNVLIHVVGEVVSPGIYEIPTHSRVVDAVMAAGGLSAQAAECAINLAREIKDGEQLLIPSVASGCSPGASEVVGTVQVSLNQATVDQFDTLPGIGPTLASRIVEWREQNGGFTSIEQLNDVSGIGDKLFSGLTDLISL